jgi:hypothetical protein
MEEFHEKPSNNLNGQFNGSLTREHKSFLGSFCQIKLHIARFAYLDNNRLIDQLKAIIMIKVTS